MVISVREGIDFVANLLTIFSFKLIQIKEKMRIIHFHCQNGEGSASYSLKTGRNLIFIFSIMMTIGRFFDAVQCLDICFYF